MCPSMTLVICATPPANVSLHATPTVPFLSPTYPLTTPHCHRLQEWEAPAPSKRPDIFPEFDKPERVFLPKPLPGDPEMPDEESEEAKKRTEPGDPDPEAKPGEPSEPEPGEGEGGEPEKAPGSIPTMPE